MTLTRVQISSKHVVFRLFPANASLTLSRPFSGRVFSLRDSETSETAETERAKERDKLQLNAILYAVFLKQFREAKKKANDEINKEKCDMMRMCMCVTFVRNRIRFDFDFFFADI